MNWFQTSALNFALPYLLGPLAFLLMQGLKQLSGLIDNLPPWAKQGVVFLTAQILVFAQEWSNQSLACGDACTINDVGPAFLKGVLVAGSAFLMHFLKQRQPSK